MKTILKEELLQVITDNSFRITFFDGEINLHAEEEGIEDILADLEDLGYTIIKK